MKNLTDEQLIHLFAEGEDAAFDELLHRYKDKLYTYIYLQVQNRDVTEDIFQDTFTKVIIRIKTQGYDEKGRFMGYLYRIARNLIIDVHRQLQYTQSVSNEDSWTNVYEDQDLTDPSYEQEMTSREIMDDVRRLIRFLPENQKEMIIMRFYKGLSFRRIAELKNISINTALGRFRYAILNMRRMAEEHNISLVG